MSRGVMMSLSYMRTKEGQRFLSDRDGRQAFLSSVRKALWRELYLKDTENHPAYKEALDHALEAIFGFQDSIPLANDLFDEEYLDAKKAFEEGSFIEGQQKKKTKELIRNPTKIGRLLIWLLCNMLIFFAVAITNGYIIYFIGLLSSCLIASWMLTSFLFPGASSKPRTGTFVKILLVGIGILCVAGFTYGHPLYVATTLAIVIHEMRILNRYNFGPLAAFLSPFISLLPIIQISHASYSELILFPSMYEYDDILGYIIVAAILVVAILLIKRDDMNLLPLLGKNVEEYAFEKVGIPKRLR